ncbi:hypothetical protein AXG93_1069s1110 [Marchantia polymorpha subsp. ruderalis]|uniref:Uncharacterized protein n=1 Tax=Marchantia polymorpha subsp. ruderalis TaxID=1480154 RepID=A0A176WDD9_MARPO|nr:hypothetical protein AXG93_1069s1110 [Marchantia polymorpha subsp. ruderalis]
MESMKAVVEEAKCFAGNSENSFWGGCCEGTVFTFTSAASNGKLRQRLRYRSITALSSYGHREEATDSVFSEMRLMPARKETSSACNEVLRIAHASHKSQMLIESPNKSSDASIAREASPGQVPYITAQKQSECHLGRQDCTKSGSSACEESVASMSKPEVTEDGVEGKRSASGEHVFERELQQSGESAIVHRANRRSGEKESKIKRDILDPKNPSEVKITTNPSTSDRKDERSHKRYSSGEQVQAFQQRKLRCAGQRAEEFASPIAIEGGCRVARVQPRQRPGSAERGGRLEIEAELKNLQARQHVTGVKWNMRRNEASSGGDHPANGLCEQRTSEASSVERKEDHGKENGRFHDRGAPAPAPAPAPRRLGLVYPSNGPLAHSFISFKGGVSSLQGRTFCFGGEGFTRTEGSALKSHGAKSMEEKEPRLLVRQESEPAVGISTRDALAQIKIGVCGGGYGDSAVSAAAAAPPETNVPVRVEGIGRQEANRIAPSDKFLRRFSGRENLKLSSASDQSSSCDLDMHCSKTRRDVASNGGVCEGRERRSGREHANTKESRYPRPLGSGRRAVELPTSTLDWYASPKNQDGVGDCHTDSDVECFQSHGDEENCSPRSTACSDDADDVDDDNDNPLSTFDLWKQNLGFGLQRLQDEGRAEVHGSDSKVENVWRTHGRDGFVENTFAVLDVLSTETSKTDRQELESILVDSNDLKSHRMRGVRRRDPSCSGYNYLPFLRPIWTRSFKKKPVERVNYFDACWGRGRRRIQKRREALKKPLSKLGGLIKVLERVEKQNRSSLPDLQAGDTLVTSRFQQGERAPSTAFSVRKKCVVSQPVLETDLLTREDKTDCLEPTYGRSSSPNIGNESSSIESSVPCSDSNSGLEKGEVSLKEQRDSKEPQDSTKARSDGTLTEQHLEGSNGKYGNGASPITTEMAQIPSSANGIFFQGTGKSESKHFSAAFSPRLKDCLTESKGITMAAFEVEKSSEDPELFDYADVRLGSPRLRHQESEQLALEDSLPFTQAMTVTGRCEYQTGKGVSDCTVVSKYLEEDALGAVEDIETSPPIHLQCHEHSIHEENLATELLVVAQHIAFCPQFSGIKSLDNQDPKLRLDPECADSASRRAPNREDSQPTEEPRTDEIPKPSTSRKHKMPIVVRVRNGLANGWLLQSFIWKRFGKQKSKAVDLQSRTSIDVSRIQYFEPLRTASAEEATTPLDETSADPPNSTFKEGNEQPSEETTNQPACEAERTVQVSESIAQSVILTLEVPLKRYVTSELVSSAPPGSSDPSATTTDQGSKKNGATSLSGASEQSSNHHNMEPAILKAQNSELTTFCTDLDDASLCGRGLQQLPARCEVRHGKEGESLENIETVTENYAIRDHCRPLSKPSTDSALNIREPQLSSDDEPAADCGRRKEGSPSEASPVPRPGQSSEDKSLSLPRKSSDEDSSLPCSEFVPAKFVQKSKKFLEPSSAQERDEDIETHVGNPSDHSLGRHHGRQKRSSPVLNSRTERVPARRRGSPDSAGSEQDDGDMSSSTTLHPTPPVPGTTPPSSGRVSKDKNTHKLLSRLLPTTGPTKCVASVPGGESPPPDPLSLKDGSSSHLQQGSNSTHCRDGISVPDEMPNLISSLLQQNNFPPRSKSVVGSGGIIQLAHGRNFSTGAGETQTCNHISCPLEKRYESSETETPEIPGYCDGDRVGGSKGEGGSAPFEGKLVSSSLRHDEGKGIHADLVKTVTPSGLRKPYSVVEGRRSDGWEIDADATAQTLDRLTGPDEQNESHGKSTKSYAASDISWTPKPDKSLHSSFRGTRETDREGSHFPQDLDSHRRGALGGEGSTKADVSLVAEHFPPAEGSWPPSTVEWNRPSTRQIQTPAPRLDQLGTCPSRCQEQSMDLQWNKPKRSSTAPIYNESLNRIRAEGFEVVQSRENRNSASCCESRAHRDVRKDERDNRVLTEGPTQDQVFLERFSAGSHDSQHSRLQHRVNGSLEFLHPASGPPRAPIIPASNCISSPSRHFPSQDELVPARQDSSTRNLNSGVSRNFSSLCTAPQQNPTIHPSLSYVEPYQPLPHEADRAKSATNFVSNLTCHTYESGLVPKFRNSFSSVSPASSINGCSENFSERHSLKPKLCFHGSTGYDPGVPWGHYSDEALDFKTNSSVSCISSIPVPAPPLVHNPSLPLDPQTYRSSCQTAQSAPPPSSCDVCNYSSLCSNASFTQHFPVGGPIIRQPQYHSSVEHPLAHHMPAYISAQPTETAITQHRRVPVHFSNCHVNECAPKATVGRYTPPQTMATRKKSWPGRETSTAPNMCGGGDNSMADCDSAHRKQQDSGLVWLTGEEMKYIRELRLSVGKDSARSLECLADPEPSLMMSYSSNAAGIREGSFYAGGSNNSHASSIISRCSNYSNCTSPRQIPEAQTTTHTVEGNSMHSQTFGDNIMGTTQGNWKCEQTLEKALKISQIVQTLQVSQLAMVLCRDNFAKSVKCIQARTEGVREIRSLLHEMSEEANRDTSAPYLYPQLCSQLQQKILQLHTALTGPQMQARFLLRRGPGTPLVLYTSKAPAVSAVGSAIAQKGGDKHCPQMPGSFPQSRTSHTQPATPRKQGSRGKVRHPNSSAENSVTEPPESAKLLPWYFLAQRSPSKPINGRRSPTGFTSSFRESHMTKKDSEEKIDSSCSQEANKVTLPYRQVPLEAGTFEAKINEIYEEQPLTLMQRTKPIDLSFDEIPIGTANGGMFSVDFGSTVEISNRPKRPFLKRKSLMMAPQKLDWSKVKPMVSSRLEPQLQTKLSYCRHTKAADRPVAPSTSRRKKENYSQVKSRLFSYEDNVSPGSSRGNTCRARYNELDEVDTSPRSRTGSIVEGASDSGDVTRQVEYQRPASPDLLRLKSQVQADTESELAFRRAQAAISEVNMEPTYSSRFDSARYLHKLGNSEQAAKDSSMQSAHPRTQRIRLRLIPGSEESEPGKVLVQKIENQEEQIRDLWHDQRIAMKNRRRQSHSHRYASYRDSSQGDAQLTSKLDESRRPSSPPDRRALKAFASSKMGLASKELEEMFERVIAAKCGRNITLSDLFEQTQVGPVSRDTSRLISELTPLIKGIKSK